jgi:hypothetical protein
MMTIARFINIGILGLLSVSQTAWAEIPKEKVYLAGSIKNNAYIKEGLFTGGDRSTDQVEILNIRRSSNQNFERIVIDLKKLGDPKFPQLQHPPYYQAALHPSKARLDMTLWGNPRLSFNPKKVLAAFNKKSAKKNSAIVAINLLPKLEDDTWTFYLDLQSGSLVEVFELTQPVRIIVDIKKKPSFSGN